MLGFVAVCGLLALAAYRLLKSPARPGLTTSKDAPATLTADYVVVGGGSTGAALAARLSEDPDNTVVLVDSGGHPSDSWLDWLLIHVPAAVPFVIARPSVDFYYQTEPQAKACQAMRGTRSIWPRGRVLGGSSCLNYMAWVRGSPADYDEMGCDGWAFRDIEASFARAEEQLKPHPRDPVHVLSKAYLAACNATGFATTPYNAPGKQEGVSLFDQTIRNGYRNHTCRAYLDPALEAGRPNLRVVTYAHASRLLFDTTAATGGNGTPRVCGVEYVCGGAGGETKTVVANKEVIVCAGAVNSPQLLLLSGIGPKQHLAKHGIDCVSDLPVGRNLQDHLAFLVKYRCKKAGTATTLYGALAPTETYQYLVHGKGASSSPAYDATLFTSSGLPGDEDRGGPDLQLGFLTTGISTAMLDKVGTTPAEEWGVPHDWTWGSNCCNICPTLLHPKSVGFLELRSADPLEPPLIEPNYLEDERDVAAMRHAIRLALRIGEQPAFREHVEQFIGPSSMDDAGIDAQIRDRAFTLYHPVGTCKMAPAGDPTGVVDQRLRVRGVAGLRVADASVLPAVPSGNTNAPCIMVGERLAELIHGGQ